jgi:hypothetical protein
MLLYQLTRPFSYLWIEGAGKIALDWIVPVVLGAVSSIILCTLPNHPQLYLFNGVFSSIASLVQGLPGFYIAALAAIAVFQRDGFDMPLPAPAPTIRVKIGTGWITIELTRRRLLTLLFGYLSALSFVLFLLILFLNAAAPSNT